MIKNVLIFDDEAELLDLIGYILDKNSYSLHTSPNCDSVLAEIEKTQPHIIFMDNNFGYEHQKGISVIQQLKSTHNFNIPIVLFTANSEIEKLARDAGADAWLAKPFEMQQFQNIIERVLNTPRLLYYDVLQVSKNCDDVFI